MMPPASVVLAYERHYLELEVAFLAFAAALPTAAGMLDGLMWDYMRRMPLGRSARETDQPDLFDLISA